MAIFLLPLPLCYDMLLKETRYEFRQSFNGYVLVSKTAVRTSTHHFTFARSTSCFPVRAREVALPGRLPVHCSSRRSGHQRRRGGAPSAAVAIAEQAKGDPPLLCLLYLLHLSISERLGYGKAVRSL